MARHPHENAKGKLEGITYDAGAPAYDAFVGRWSAAFGPTLLAAAGVTAGHTVLEVAAGTGGLTVMAASAVGTSGRVVATDLSLPMLGVASGKTAGLPVDLVVMDGQDLAFRDQCFDVVICQLGLMFFPDVGRGLREFRRVLRGNGRLAVQVWSRPDRVPFFGLLSDALSRYYPKRRDALYAPSALADPNALRQLLAEAGFQDVSVVKETQDIAFESFDAYWSSVEAGGGRLGQFYLELREEERRAVRDEVSRRMVQFVSNGLLVLRAEALVGTASVR
jgi:ubiquinone/menaquinone biosynthesis C-methylase UbiE